MRCTVIAILSLLLATTATARADEPVGILLTDGRFASGSLDSATDAARLWIHTTDNGIVLRSSFDWNRIARIVHDSKQHTPSEFRNLIGQLQSSSPTLAEPDHDTLATADGLPAALRAVTLARHDSVEPSPPPVRSLRGRAWAASWDSDPELDGVLVEITALGPFGEFVAVDGLLSLTLLGEYSQGHPEHLRRFRPRYPEMARASVQVQAEHFEGGHAVYQLPYQNILPEGRLDVFPQGVVTATLGVSGQGNFTASTDALSLIPASPIRDRRQQLFGRRYFPQELSNLRNPSRFGDDRKTSGVSLGYSLP